MEAKALALARSSDREIATKQAREAHLAAIGKLTATDIARLAMSAGISPSLLLHGGIED